MWYAVAFPDCTQAAPSLEERTRPALSTPASPRREEPFYWTARSVRPFRQETNQRPTPPEPVAKVAAEDVLKAFRELGIDPRTRPEDLSVAMWRRLAHALKDLKQAEG